MNIYIYIYLSFLSLDYISIEGESDESKKHNNNNNHHRRKKTGNIAIVRHLHIFARVNMVKEKQINRRKDNQTIVTRASKLF